VKEDYSLKLKNTQEKLNQQWQKKLQKVQHDILLTVSSEQEKRLE
jgi:hypothetical protein